MYSRASYAEKKLYLYRSNLERCHTYDLMRDKMKDPAKGFSIPGFPLTLAEGDYVTVLNDPEYWQPHEIEHLLALVRIRKDTAKLIELADRLIGTLGIALYTTSKFYQALSVVRVKADEAMEITALNYKEM
jgi:hypothetical protein